MRSYAAQVHIVPVLRGPQASVRPQKYLTSHAV